MPRKAETRTPRRGQLSLHRSTQRHARDHAKRPRFARPRENAGAESGGPEQCSGCTQTTSSRAVVMCGRVPRVRAHFVRGLVFGYSTLGTLVISHRQRHELLPRTACSGSNCFSRDADRQQPAIRLHLRSPAQPMAHGGPGPPRLLVPTTPRSKSGLHLVLWQHVRRPWTPSLWPRDALAGRPVALPVPHRPPLCWPSLRSRLSLYSLPPPPHFGRLH